MLYYSQSLILFILFYSQSLVLSILYYSQSIVLSILYYSQSLVFFMLYYSKSLALFTVLLAVSGAFSDGFHIFVIIMLVMLLYMSATDLWILCGVLTDMSLLF